MSRLLELINRQLRRQTNRIGQVVTNMHGATPGRVGQVQDVAGQSWLVAPLLGTELLTLDEFFFALAAVFEPASLSLVPAVDGSATFRSAVPSLVLMRTLVRSDTAVTIPLQVDAAGGAIAVYVNGKLERRASGALDLTLRVEPGAALVEVLALTAQLTVRSGTGVELDGEGDFVPLPVWDSIVPDYMDATLGVPAVRLTWFSEGHAGGWRVQRRRVADLSAVLAVSTPDPTRVIGLTLDGDYSSVDIGSEVFVQWGAVGVVLSGYYDSVALETSLRIRLHAGVTPDSTWVGTIASSGSFEDLAVVRRTIASGTVRWDDTAVTTGQLYEYRLQAYGAINTLALSSYSDVLSVRAGDVTAPGSIVLVAGYPVSLNRRITVRFTTPADADYAGVRVYYRPTVETTISSVSGLTFGLTDVIDMAVNDYAGWLVFADFGGGEAAEVRIAGNTATLFTMTTALTPPFTVGQVVTLYTVREVITDYGLPATEDELSFTPEGDGTYYFATFDRSGNEQRVTAAVSWDYGATIDDEYSAPPVVSIRQLTPAEQLLFAAPYDSATRWTIVLIDARDVTGAVSDVTMYYQRKGEDAVSMPAATAPLLAGLPHNPSPIDAVAGPPVGAGDRVLDVPAGTRSRFVAIERTAAPSFIRVWAENDTGLESGRSQFTVDYNETPEVSAIEVTYDEGRTNALGTDGIAEVRVVVDDDTRSFKIWVSPAEGTEPTSGTPALFADTALTGSVGGVGSISMGSANRKTVYVQPFSGPNLTGTAGEIVQRDLSRPPRSEVVFESKDRSGKASSSTVKASFLLSPAPTQAWPTSGSPTIASVTDSGLTVSGTPWTASQWAKVSQTDQLYVVEVVMVRSGVTLYTYREVLSNTTSALTVDLAWPASGELRPLPGDLVRIWSGSIVARVGSPSVAGVAWGQWENLLPPTQALYFDRGTAEERYVEYYGTLTGVPQETPKRVLVDADNAPAIGSITLAQVGNKLRISIVDVDDDVKQWHVYARKGPTWVVSDPELWPTIGNTVHGPLDDKYLRMERLVSDPSFDLAAGAGAWYVIVVPFNSLNDPAERTTWPSAHFNVVGTAVAVPALNTLRAEVFDDVGTSKYVNRIRWNHTDVLEAATTTKVEVAVSAPVLGFGSAGVYQVLTPGTPGVLVQGDYLSYAQSLATDLAQDVGNTGQGSWPMVLTGSPFVRGTVSDLAVTVAYRVRLFVSGSLVASYSWTQEEYWVQPLPDVTTAGLFITDGTKASGFIEEPLANPPCNAPEVHELSWETQFPNPATHYVQIARATDTINPPTTFVLARDGVAGDITSDVFTLSGYYTPVAGGTTQYVRYRVRMLRISDDGIEGEVLSNVASVRRAACDGYDS